MNLHTCPILINLFELSNWVFRIMLTKYLLVGLKKLFRNFNKGVFRVSMSRQDQIFYMLGHRSFNWRQIQKVSHNFVSNNISQIYNGARGPSWICFSLNGQSIYCYVFFLYSSGTFRMKQLPLGSIIQQYLSVFIRIYCKYTR